MKMMQQLGIGFLLGVGTFIVGSKMKQTMGADTVQTTDPFQQKEFESLPPMPNATEVIDNMMLRDDTNEALMAQNAPMVAPPELNMVNLLAAIKGADGIPATPTVTV